MFARLRAGIAVGLLLLAPSMALGQSSPPDPGLGLPPPPSDAPLATERVFPRGSSWGVVPPPGFSLVMEPIVRFQHPSGVTIFIQEAPKAPVSRVEIEKERNADMQVISVEDMQAGDRKGVYFEALHIPRKARVHSLVLEGEAGNAMVMAVVPDAARDAVPRQVLLASLTSALERPRTEEEKLASLPFQIGDRAGMRVSTIGLGTVAVLTDGSSDDTDAPYQSFATIVAIRLPAGQTLDFDRDIHAMAARVQKQFPGASIISRRVIEVGGSKVAEIVYERSVKTGARVAGIAWAKVTGGALALVMGQYPMGNANARARLVKVRDGLTVR